MNGGAHTHSHSPIQHIFIEWFAVLLFTLNTISARMKSLHIRFPQPNGWQDPEKEEKKIMIEHNIEERTAAQHTENENEYERTQNVRSLSSSKMRVQTHAHTLAFTHILMLNWEFRIDTHVHCTRKHCVETSVRDKVREWEQISA